MGNEQSTKSQAEAQKAEMRRLLNEQRRMYEKKCQEVMEQVKAQTTQNAQTTNQNPSPVAHPAQAPQSSYAPPPTYPSQPMHAPPSTYGPQTTYAPPPAHAAHTSNQGPSMPGPSLERQRAPYSYVREDLQNAMHATAPSAPNLYPNLNNRDNQFTFVNKDANPARDFVFVNHSGAQRNRPSAPSRDRSISRSRNQNNDSEFLCPTCKTVFGLQIYQCNRGHSSCNSCKEQGRCCGICGNSITTMRNFALEGFVAEQRMPCRFNKNGCTLSFKMSEMDIHCRECPFKELQCPLDCFWRGQLKQLTQHFDALHPEQRSVDINSEIQLRNISSNSQNVYLILIGFFNFLFHVKVSAIDRKIYMVVQLIGTKVSASKWSYELHVYNKSDYRRKFTFSDAVISHAEPITDIFSESKCSVLPYAYAETFMNHGALTYKLFIKKTTDNGPRGDFGKNQRGRRRN